MIYMQAAFYIAASAACAVYVYSWVRRTMRNPQDFT
tara:strand:- start:3076 stop:3183 length:108 start_codon:yes stop_codon:yes gene_type:complete